VAILVNGERIEDEIIRAEASILKSQLISQSPGEDSLTIELQAREWARETVIRRVLLEQAEAEVRQLTEQIPRPKQKEVSAFYRQCQTQFVTPELCRAAHIVKNVDETATEAEAQSALQRIQQELRAGADFAELADRSSDCPGQGGDLGFFAPDEMVDEFQAAVAELKPGETSGIFRSPFGFHIVKLIERRPKVLRSLNEVRTEIEKELWGRKKRLAIEELLDRLRSKAEVKRV
jgi:parvulin-like peptidyl-prolyl isomerase